MNARMAGSSVTHRMARWRVRWLPTALVAGFVCLCDAAAHAVVAQQSNTGFEVSGSPDSYAVARVDESSGTRGLSLAVYEEGQPLPFVRHLSKELDTGQRILLSKYLGEVAVGW